MRKVRKDLTDVIVIGHKTDLINQPYFILLEILDLDP